MTNQQLFQAIRSEIERRKDYAGIGLCAYDAGYENAICELSDSLLSFLDILETEQKPAEWSEQDIQYYDAVMDMITNAKYLPCRPRDEIVEWFKSLPERFNLQPKQEWSEEDKHKLNRIYEILGYAADDKGFLTSKRIIGDKEAIELQDFLRSISKPQSPELSGEDEKRVKQLIYDTEFIKAHYEKRKEELGEQFNNALIRDCDEQIAWLKSLRLRPSWKPSEHQMTILKAVKEYVGRGSGYWGEALGSLIEDLEKL